MGIWKVMLNLAPREERKHAHALETVSSELSIRVFKGSRCISLERRSMCKMQE